MEGAVTGMHDPLVLLGIVLLGVFAAVFIYVQIKMKSAGYDTFSFIYRPRDWGLPAAYLKICAKYHSPRWPVYLMWSCLILGVMTFFLGAFYSK